MTRSTKDPRRIGYAGSVHDEREIEAVVAVLRGGPTALRIGRNVRAMEQRVAGLFGKRRGVMCNSGSSALYLAVDLLDLEPGDEVVTAAVTFSTDLAPILRAGAVPAFVDVERRTYNLDVSLVEQAITERTKALLVPNLIGGAPDWDALRALADDHGLAVVEDSCDALGPTLRDTPTAARADISVTSFALSHIITAAGTGGMVLVDDDALADRCLLLRRWGRRSEVQLFGSTKGVDTRFFSSLDDGLEYDNLFIFDEVGWNLEPSELSAAFGLVQLRKLAANLARRRRNAERLATALAAFPDVFELPAMLDSLDSVWHLFPVLLRPEAGVRRSAFQQHMEAAGIDTRMVWTGNVLRQPAFKGIAHRAAPGGYPEADRVMEHGVVLPTNHGLDDDDIDHIGATAAAFVERGGLS
jgi:CDP-6-deoxy-D-xylo-4-hexulose-3-dehydrase